MWPRFRESAAKTKTFSSVFAKAPLNANLGHFVKNAARVDTFVGCIKKRR